jgi:two-component sensor histidine kinase
MPPGKAYSRVWIASAVAVATLLIGLSGYLIKRDHDTTLRASHDRAHSMARLLIAHSDASLEGAERLVAMIEPMVKTWDFQDENRGRELSVALKNLIPEQSQISSAWITDGSALNRVDSWSYPARPIDASTRPYWKAHKAGAPDPVIVGDPRPGAISGRERFTFSKALRRLDGSIQAVIVIGIYKDVYDRLYTNAVSWPGARAILYAPDGSLLGRLLSAEPPSPEFARAVLDKIRFDPSGWGVVTERGSARIVAWQASAKYPGISATTSQDLASVFSDWRSRTIWTVIATFIGLLGFLGTTLFATRAAAAREKVELAEVMAREVHHRVKNALQIVASLLSIRASQITDSQSRELIREAVGQIQTVALVQGLLQICPEADHVDVSALIQSLCQHIKTGSDRDLVYAGPKSVSADSSRATMVGIIANELITNAIKHGTGRIDVELREPDGEFELVVRDEGAGPAADFDVSKTDRLGLATVIRLVNRLKGQITWTREPRSQVTVRLPFVSEHQ